MSGPFNRAPWTCGEDPLLECMARFLDPPCATHEIDWETEARAASGVDEPPAEDVTLPSDLGAC